MLDGFRVLHDAPLTQNERDWIEMLRAICGDEVPGPTLKAVQALRVAMNAVTVVRREAKRSNGDAPVCARFHHSGATQP